MKNIITALLLLYVGKLPAQELFLFTEPASNMPAKSIGVRMGAKLFKMTHDNRYSAYRLDPELMLGISKNLMIHINGYASDMFQSNLKAEGASIYAKWRFFSHDAVHTHFRLAAFGKLSVVNNPTTLTVTGKHAVPDGSGGFIYHDILKTTINNEIDLDGTNSGVMGGLIATKLMHKLALSSSVAYSYRLNNIKDKREVIVPWKAVSYTFSAGYLLLPREYKDYRQTNVNLYLEYLGTTSIDKKMQFADIAPGIQFIINSIARLDVGWRTQIAGNTPRMNNSSFLIRVEYNFLNALSKK
jgi:hypothetical protein